MYFYQLYGLHIQSSHLLTGPLASNALTAPDLTVNWAGDAWDSLDGQRGWEVIATPELQQRPRINLWQAKAVDGLYLRLQFVEASGVIEFVIDPSASVMTIYWPPSLLFADIEAYFVGSLLGALLRYRGTIALHASAVTRDGRAIAILGRKHAGKSTTAAALVEAGWHLLADDLAVLDFDDEVVKVQAGYPRLRLWPEAVSTLYGTVDNLTPVFSDRLKRYVEISAGGASRSAFCPQALPLSTIYLLGDRSVTDPAIVNLPAHERMMSLIFNTMGNYMVLNPAMRKREFRLIRRIAERIPIRQLHPPDRIAALPELCEMILADQHRQEEACLAQ